MQQSKKVRYIIVLFLLGVSVVALVGWNICVGSVRIPLADILHPSGRKNRKFQDPLGYPNAKNFGGYDLRWCFGTCRVSVADFFSQSDRRTVCVRNLFRCKNGGGTCHGVFVGQAVKITSWALIAAAFVGAMISMGFVLLMSRRVHNMSMIVVSGVMIGYICSAITELVVTFASDAEIVNLHNWSRGSFSGMTWENVAVMTGVVAVTFFLVFLMAKPLSAYQLGEVYARNLGVDIRCFA